MATYSVTTLIDAAHGFRVIDLETDGLIQVQEMQIDS